MIKCEVIKQFTFKRFDELKNINRKSIEVKGKLLVGDTFECTKDIADYLLGDNAQKLVVVKILEVEPEVKHDINVVVDCAKVQDEVVVKKSKKKNKK